MDIWNALLFTAVDVKMKLGDNTLNNNERRFTGNDETSDKKLSYCSPYFIALQYIDNLETKRSY